MASSSSTDETLPLLATPKRKKPFYRARPLWLVPFAITASLVRGMTLAPRVEVFTQLSCNQLYGHHDWNHTTTTLDPFRPPILFDTDDDDPRRIPSARCSSDPAVQAGAARLQTVMTTTMGLLSALTTGWWGHFGERHGRTSVLATATLGLFLTDLTFILVSTPSSPLSQHGHKLLLVAPVIEGLLGGWSTLQSATSAYLSDCTSPGSRAHIFSRFTGVFYLGFAIGPSIGGWLIARGDKTVTSVFWVAIACSLINFLLVLLVFPESLPKERRNKVHEQKQTGFLSPLAVFLPVVVGRKNQRDWSLTMLALALFAYMLSTGLYQIKYLYAVHTYSWAAEQLSYYISAMGGMRALWLLFLLPTIIGFFKPAETKKPKSKPTRAHLGREIAFDLILTRCSLLIDILSHTLVAVLPSTGYRTHVSSKSHQSQMSFSQSQAAFVVASSLSSLGSGLVPAVHSLALCILQVRKMDADAATGAAVGDVAGAGVGEEVVPVQVKEEEGEEGGTGALFGALAVLQAVGQMILGPMLFGLIYSSTVAQLPKAIFITSAGICVFALTMVFCVANPVRPPPSALARAGSGVGVGKNAGKGKNVRRRPGMGDVERGRSRVSKDLRGGAVEYYYAGADGQGAPESASTSYGAIATSQSHGASNSTSLPVSGSTVSR